MKPPSAAPVAVVPPPMRTRVPAASRRRRNLRFCRWSPALISDSCSFHSPQGGSDFVERFEGVARLVPELGKGEGGESRGYLSIDRRLVVNPSGFYHGVELFDHDATTLDGCAGAGHLLVPPRHIAVRGEDRDPTAGVTNHVLNFPLLGGNYDDAVLGNRVGEHGHQSRRALRGLIARGDIGEIGIENDRDV